MFRRASTMAFVPDAVVFPGGGVDATDYDFSGAWCGPTPQDWAHLLNCTPCHARGIIVAAVRELFEESGILLASDEHGAMAHDVCGDHWAKERALIAHRSLRLDDFLTCEHLVLRTDLLHLRSHWVTPPSEKRRYDTYFFAVRKPADQHADARTSEAVESSWITPREALMRAKKGYLKLMPPTVSNLCSLERAATVDEAYELPFDGHVEPFPFLNEEGKVVMRAEVH
jgi:8-oxo-dGTP pyrophosphatase MutT (NUDIX family)